MKKILISLFVAFLSATAFADAPPSWASPNPADYQFSMTVTARLSANGVYLEDNTDQIAAFVSGSVRGLSAPTVYVASTNEYVVFMQIYSNTASGENITFKMYDASADLTVDAITTLTFQNNTAVGSNTQPLLITDNNQPTAIALTSTFVDENQSAGTTVGTFSATDADVADTHTYSLVSGDGDTANTLFSISGTSLQTAQVFNYENKSSYSIRVRVTDSKQGTYEQAFTIMINNTNDAPTALSLSASTITENSPVGTLIGEFNTTDVDAADTHSYSLVAGTGDTDNASFEITDNGLRVAVETNYENKSSYSIRVKTTDASGAYLEKGFTLTVLNVNEKPSALTLSNTSIAEKSASLTTIGTLNTTDEDTGDSHSYSFVDGSNDNDSFVLDGSTLKSFGELNFENDPVYIIKIRTEDNAGATLDKQFTINVTDVNDDPTDIALSATSIAENLSTGASLATLTTEDEDFSDTFTYSMVAGTGDDDNASFSINTNSLLTAASFDYETKSEYSIRLQVADASGATFQKEFAITVVDKNDAPINLSVTATSISESQLAGTLVGSLLAEDPDAGDTHTFSLVSGSGDQDNDDFIITGNGLYSAVQFDFETKSSYSIRVRVTDQSGAYYQETIAIAITDSNDAPSALSLSNTSIAENNSISQTVGTLSTTDEDATDNFEYTLNQEFDYASFYLEGADLKVGKVLDFESKVFYTVKISSTDKGGEIISKQFVIKVTDVNDNPSMVSLDNSNINEGQTIGSLVGNLSTTDQDVSDTYTYSLVTGTGDDNNDYFSISSDELLIAQTIDFETTASLKARIRSADGSGQTVEKAFVVTINDENDAPTGLELSKNTVAESADYETRIGSFSTTDPDNIDQHSYELVSGTGSDDNASFIILNGSLYTADTYDFEAKDSYTIRVATIDKGGLTFEKAFDITITDANDAPDNIMLSATTFAENQPINTSIITLSASDQDASDTFTYALGSTDMSGFYIEGNEIKTSALFNYEKEVFYTISIKVSDTKGASFEKQFVLQVTNINDAPTNIELSNTGIGENLESGAEIGELSTEDEDVVDSYTYQFVSGNGSDDNGNFTIDGNKVVTVAAFDFETKSSYKVRISTTDNGGLSTERAFVINVTDANDAPTDIALSNYEVEENLPKSTEIGTLSTSDADAVDSFTYKLVQGEGSDDNGFFGLSDNGLLTGQSFDYESQSSFSIRVRSTDKSGAYVEKSFSIEVINTNDAPTSLSISSDKINENQGLLATVGTFSTTDVDPNNTFTYSFIKGSDEDFFIIDGDALKAKANLDFESRSLYSVEVKTTDNSGGSYSQNFALHVVDVNDAPVSLSLDNTSVKENAQSGILVGEFSTEDEDVNDSHTFSLISGNGDDDNGSFSLKDNQLLSAKTFDYESQSELKIRVKVTDASGGTFEESFVIAVIDQNDAPTGLSISDSEFEENLPLNTAILTIETIDNSADEFVYSLVDGAGSDDNYRFRIDGNQLVTRDFFDKEQTASVSVRIRTTDPVGSFEQSFTLEVTDVNEAPVMDDQTFYLMEQSPAGTVVGTVKVYDEDEGQALTFTLLNNQVDDRVKQFSIDENGVLTVLDDELSYEDVQSISLEIVVADDGLVKLGDTAVITILLEDQIESELPVNNVVTPNGDGMNDVFFIQNVSLYSSYTLKIMDAYGSEVFKITGYQNDWTGQSSSGKTLPTGSYLYQMKSPDSSYVYQGSITIINE